MVSCHPTASTVVPLPNFFYAFYWPKLLAASAVVTERHLMGHVGARTGSVDSELGFCLMLCNSSQTNDIPNEAAGLGAKCCSAKE